MTVRPQSQSLVSRGRGSFGRVARVRARLCGLLGNLAQRPAECGQGNRGGNVAGRGD